MSMFSRILSADYEAIFFFYEHMKKYRTAQINVFRYLICLFDMIFTLKECFIIVLNIKRMYCLYFDSHIMSHI